MLDLDQIRKKLQDRNLSEISRQTGLNYYTINKAKHGGNVRYNTVKVLSDYLLEAEK